MVLLSHSGVVFSEFWFVFNEFVVVFSEFWFVFNEFVVVFSEFWFVFNEFVVFCRYGHRNLTINIAESNQDEWSLFIFALKVEDEVSNLKEKLEVSGMKCSLLTEECNKMKSQLQELLRVKEVSLFLEISTITFKQFKCRSITILCQISGKLWDFISSSGIQWETGS